LNSFGSIKIYCSVLIIVCHIPTATSTERKKVSDVWFIPQQIALLKQGLQREGGEASCAEVEAMLNSRLLL